MKRNIWTQVAFRTSLAVVFGLALCFPIQLQSTVSESGNNMMEGKMTKRHQNHSMQEQQQIISDMKVQDAELTAELERIKSAPDKQKMELLIEVVNRMVEQRTALHERLGEMMNHMNQQMQADGGAVSTYSMRSDINYLDVHFSSTDLETGKF